MTDLKALRGEIARKAASFPGLNGGELVDVRLLATIEAALLQFVREALREEADDEMLQAAAMSCEWPHWYSDANVKEICVDVWLDMAEQRARGLE